VKAVEELKKAGIKTLKDEEWDSNEGGENICARRGTQRGNNMITPRHPNRRAQREIEDEGTGYKELLVARNNKGSGKICGWMRYLSKIQKLEQSTSRKTNVQYNPQETMKLYFSRLHH